MGMLDFFTGGRSDDAAKAMEKARQYYENIVTPTVEELTLPELQKYVEAGIMTPAEAMAYLQERNAYEDMTVPQTGTEAQISAINRLAQVADAGPEGTPMQQAQMANTIANMNRNVAGQRGAIEQAMAAKGTPAALIQAALMNQTVGQEAQQAHLDAVNAQAAAYQTALEAMARGGDIGNQLQGQQNAQANQIAAAANAMQQFNAQNQQNSSQFNAANRQASNAYNAQNRQNVANLNTGTANERTKYNTQLPQQVFANNMAKAQGMSGATTNLANLYQQQGGQNAAIVSGLMNTASNILAPEASFMGMGASPGGSGGAGGMDAGASGGADVEKWNGSGWEAYNMAHGGIVEDPAYCAADGMVIPGESTVPGDSYANDTVPIMASPGEAIIPRSKVNENPEVVDSLLDPESEVVDSRDVATLLKAMRALRMGAIQ